MRASAAGSRRHSPARAWYRGVPAVTAEVECDGARHCIAWHRGKLVLENHDILAEQSLTALGARRPLCVEVLEAWRSTYESSDLVYDLLVHHKSSSPDDLPRMRARHEAAIERASRGPREIAAALRQHPQCAEHVARLERQLAAQVERERRLWRSTLVKALPPALRRALGLSLIVGIGRHWGDEDVRREHGRELEFALTAIAGPLLERSARRWRGNLQPEASFLAEAWLLRPSERAVCSARIDKQGLYAALSLPLAWFTDVWARGLALVDDCFVMGVLGTDRPGGQRVAAVRWERRDRKISQGVVAPAVVTRRRGGDWRLRWT